MLHLIHFPLLYMIYVTLLRDPLHQNINKIKSYLR